MSRHVALATCAEFPQGDEDAAALVSALGRCDISGFWRAWTDPAVDWAAFAAVVVRSTWDYPANLEAFVSWANSVPRLHNSADVIAWNSDKRYLSELAARGVPTVPTLVLEPGEIAELPNHEFVVKPSVGAGSKGAGRFVPDQAGTALAHMQLLHDAGRVVLIQPYLGDVDTAGETALMYFNGRYSHAVRKGAMLPADTANDLSFTESLYVAEEISTATPSSDELRVGDQVVAGLAELGMADLLYCRVDLLPSPDGPVLIEVELTEPSLFLGYDAQAADRFAAALAERLS